MSTNDEIILAIEGKIATITLNLPKKLNALNARPLLQARPDDA